MYHCSRQDCSNIFKRVPSQRKKVRCLYCSRRCAAIINNKKYPKNPAIVRVCQYCGKEYKKTFGKVFCSVKCKYNSQFITNKEIISWIQNFYNQNGRIPYKTEYSKAKAARLRFGSWNNAIESAGYKPNPVRFADKFIANDGHKCDSLAEKVIDDWLPFKKIVHEKSSRYPNSKFTSDFKVGETYIEFFGLTNGLNKYDRLKEEKLKMISQNNHNLISIFPKDIFPESKLNLILGNLN